MASVLVLGSTGMTGSHILSSLLSLHNSSISQISTISRRQPQVPASTAVASGPRLSTHIEKDTTKWSTFIASPSPQIVFSGLATTRAAAGGFDKQYLLEHDLNIDLARQAKESGTTTYVLISSSGADPNSYFAYPRMKGEIERDVLALDFDHTITLRPGLIGGRREESRPAEAVIRWIADGLGRISGGLLKDFWTQDADVIGRAAVRAGLRATSGQMGKKIVLNGSEILELGRSQITEAEKTGGGQ